MKPLVLPWADEDVPHAMVDINRGCNIRCRACYNAREPENRSLVQIAADIDALLRLRKLHTITITGGEPLLHPELVSIVRTIKSRGLRVAMASNGQRLDDTQAARLAEIGLDLVLLHIDLGQIRADLADATSRIAVRQLREEKIRLLARHGITAGMLSTAFDDDLESVVEAVQLALDLPHLKYVVFTGHVDFPQYGPILGSVAEGLRMPESAGSPPAFRQTTTAACRQLMARRFHAQPFATLPSRGAVTYDAWLSYKAVVAYNDERRVDSAFLVSSLTERLGLRLLRRKQGRYTFFHEESQRLQHIQVLLNAATGGRPARNIRMLSRAANGHRLEMKHIVFQQGPTPDSSGAFSICRDCPDAVVRDGRLLPVCIADRIPRS